MKQAELGNLFKTSLRSITVFRLCWKETDCCKFPVSHFCEIWQYDIYQCNCQAAWKAVRKYGSRYVIICIQDTTAQNFWV